MDGITMINDIKVLVVSVSAWNSCNGMNTWPTLLANFNPDNVANICLREECPDSKACNNYFVISENRVIKSVIKRGIKTGHRVERTEITSESNDLIEHNERYKKMKKRRSFFTLMAREVLWKLGKWKTKELREFVTKFSPDVILYSMDGYIHMNRLCRYVCKISGAPSIGFFVDDNFTYKQSARLGDKFFRFFQRRSLKRVAKKTSGFWAITAKTKEEADKVFGVNCEIITKPMAREGEYYPWDISSPIKILYTGNLGIGRDRSLLKLCKAIKTIGEGSFFVDVYTNTVLSDDILLNIDPGICNIHPPISQQDVIALQTKADLLLFLEDIDGRDSKIARLSFSTKITDYLSSGRAIFAIGNYDTAPMQYFENNGSAIIASSEEQIAEKLKQILENKAILHEYAQRAVLSGNRNHNKDVILASVERTIREVALSKENR